jgi:hypothetical protein
MKLTNQEGRELLNGKKKKPVTRWQQPKLTESQQQAESVAWFRQQYPQFARNLFAIPNGGFRNPKTAAILKREGVLAGVPDTFLAIPRKDSHGLFIELKTAKGKPTELQLQMMAILTVHGYKCEVVYSIDEFKKTITNYLNAA